MDRLPTPLAAADPSARPTRFLSSPCPAVRRPPADLEEMVGMGFFPEEVGLAPGITRSGPEGPART